MQSFPPELIGNIVEAVDDTPTLLNCLILSRSLSFHAIRALYKSVTLDGERLQAFREAVEANRHYARHIASFSIRHTRSPLRNANIRSIANAAANHNLNYVLSKAPNLRVLKMRLTTWTWADFEASLGPSTQCPWKLTTLVWCDDRSPLELIVAHQGTLEHVQIDRLACQGMAKWGHSFKKLSFPNLRSMRLPYGPRVEPEALGMRKEEWKAAWTTVVEERDGLNMLWSRIR
ncbi:F-box domain-containing protein [Pleurotus pulmonarius]